LVVDEEDVAHYIVGRTGVGGPCVTAIVGLEQCAFAADSPASVLIEKEDRVQP
jgi:hypothetical protein